MNSPSLNAMPSPSDPLQMPADEKQKNYSLLYYAAQQIRKIAERSNPPEMDEMLEMDRVVAFSGQKISALVGSDAFAGAPEQPPAPPQAMPGQPAAGSPPPVPMGAGSPPAMGGSPV